MVKFGGGGSITKKCTASWKGGVGMGGGSASDTKRYIGRWRANNI